MIVCADSQCFSYVVDAMQGIDEPADDLADEKKAIFRCYLYLPGTLHSTPRVIVECGRIKDAVLRELHRKFLTQNFDVVRPPSATRVDSLAATFEIHHGDPDDCRILAEAIEGGADTFLTYDNRLISRLASRAAPVRVLRPSEFWSSLGITKGTKPDKVPHPTNPLSNQHWWLW